MPATKAQVLIKEFVIHHEGIRSLTSKLCGVSPSGTSSRIEPMSPVPPKPTSYPLGILESTFAPSNASAAAPTINRRICNWFDWEQDREYLFQITTVVGAVRRLRPGLSE
jgi:hypothetical protein